MTAERHFDTLKSQDIRNERRIFWNEVAIILDHCLAGDRLSRRSVGSGLVCRISASPVSSTISQFAIGRAVSSVR